MIIISEPSQSGSRAASGRATRWVLAVAAGLGLAVCGVCWRLAAQEVVSPRAPLGEVKSGFFIPDYYDPPNQNQMKSLLRGAEAQHQPDGSVVIKELQVETYSTNGKTMMIVRAPECNYDLANQTATSSNHIEAASGDGKLYIEGEGFRWDQNHSIFTISNRVHTTIRQEPEKTAVP
jgi:hypothetical protein